MQGSERSESRNPKTPIKKPINKNNTLRIRNAFKVFASSAAFRSGRRHFSTPFGSIKKGKSFHI